MQAVVAEVEELELATIGGLPRRRGCEDLTRVGVFDQAGGEIDDRSAPPIAVTDRGARIDADPHVGDTVYGQGFTGVQSEGDGVGRAGHPQDHDVGDRRDVVAVVDGQLSP
ncbi:unannotated protein [freshwater metagenome]|uniref:Unannotated protein n=1 Tax=freshwater metagenome TaxID=449393 RepID=A0A6J7LM35_9ZZZZ